MLSARALFCTKHRGRTAAVHRAASTLPLQVSVTVELDVDEEDVVALDVDVSVELVVVVEDVLGVDVD